MGDYENIQGRAKQAGKAETSALDQRPCNTPSLDRAGSLPDCFCADLPAGAVTVRLCPYCSFPAALYLRKQRVVANRVKLLAA